MASLNKRVEALEAKSGGAGCARCGGLFIVLLNGEIESATRNGSPVPLEEARALSEGGCPECKNPQSAGYVIRLKGLDEKPRGPAV